jgi:hypothetical protein
VSTPSPTTSPATGTSAGSRSRDGPSRHRAGGRTPTAPPTFLKDRLGEAQVSAAQKHLSRWAPHRSGPSAGPLGRGEPPNVSLSPLSCHALSPAAGAMTTLQRREAVTMRANPTCCSSQPPRWQNRHSTTARATSPHQRRRPAPPPSASWRGYHCDRTWQSSVSCAALCMQCTSSPPRPCFGSKSPPPGEAPWPR